MSVIKIKNSLGEWEEIRTIKGEDGYSPVRGVDYWTAQDKAEVVAETEESVRPLKEAAELAASSAQSSASNAATSEANASASASSASESASTSTTAKNTAVSAKETAVSAKDLAVEANTSAQAAKTAAETAQGLAEDARDDAVEARDEAESILGEVVRYDEDEISGTDIPINADQLNGHQDTYFAKQVDFADLEEEVEQNTNARHTHYNKGILDTITQAMINAISTIADKYVKPTDGIPKSDLSEGVQSSLDKADNSGTYSKPDGGIPKSDFADSVKESLSKADTALQSYNITYTIEEVL